MRSVTTFCAAASLIGLVLVVEVAAQNPAPDIVLNRDFLVHPLELTAQPLPFVDWSLVEAGHVAWVGPDGEPAPLNDPHDIERAEDVRAMPVGLAHGVRIQTQPARKGPRFNETFPRDFPWEEGRLQPHTLLHDTETGLYRLWYECRGGIAYAESTDLGTWKKPLLNPEARDEQSGSNLTFFANHDAIAASGVFQHPESLRVAASGTVFVDPSAPPAERFKCTVLASSDPAKLQAFVARTGKPLGSRVSPNSGNCLYPAWSADGVAWTLGLEPNLLQDADTQTVVHFDTEIKRYVAYTRNWDFDRRVIARSESENFNDFPLPRTVLRPDSSEAPWTDFYLNTMTPYPGQPDLRLILCLAYDRQADSSSIRLATSRDGANWEFSPGPPLVSPGSADAWDAYFPMPHPGLVRKPDGGFLLYYSGYKYPHKFPRSRFQEGDSGAALWDADRLVAIEAESEGEFTTSPLRLRGKQVRINATTSATGEIRAELLDKEFGAIAGRGLSEALPVKGDHADVVLAWTDGGDLAAQEGEFVRVRFVMRNARIFSIRAE
ncbi:MAG: hypothetical protein JNK74_25230 [Candidatus Hydrogenedentes bacterium]|nr:hypothetical protein [Candidatus Hydrogenedentota bacterium]